MFKKRTMENGNKVYVELPNGVVFELKSPVSVEESNFNIYLAQCAFIHLKFANGRRFKFNPKTEFGLSLIRTAMYGMQKN